MLTKQVIEALTEAAGAESRHDSDRAIAYARDLLGSLAPDCEPLLLELERRYEELDRLRALAGRDPLTQAANRRTFEEELGRELARHRRTAAPFALILLDVDDLKQRNDSFGHAAGDEALVALTRACQGTLRDTDLLARIGGDEFAVLLPGSTQAGAVALSQRLREAVESLEMEGGPLRVSLGCASTEQAKSPEAIKAAADQELYRDKVGRKARERAA
ncbi:MAG TPA: GGDEF domain-containing protein [Polyangiales bacterium]|nr:GGDEF domain-containing protein [Polyangiales bacterium]